MDGPDFDPADLSSKREWVKIGSGSFGNVYKATLLGTTVAVKEIGKCVPPADARPFVILPPSISSSPYASKRASEISDVKKPPRKNKQTRRAAVRSDFPPPFVSTDRTSPPC